MLRMTRKLLVMASLIVALLLPHSGVFAYTNYMTLPSEDGIGDPFIMKYNGTYYLYTSTGTSSFKCWRSTDTVNWTYAGICASDPIITNGYAPEVVYWNGTFYMYTSPNGGGHYVLTSSSPTGPFTVATGNLGHSIDGDVFIEDDGSWYFLSAGGDGIHSAPMSSPTSIGSDTVLGGTQISGQWTEAPTLIKRNGTYYLTETGNHVVSPGYRVNLATNTAGPLSAFTPSNQNPILLNSEGGTNQGLGHNGMYIGPDLDTYYVAYHNLVGTSARHLNLEAVGWNGDKMVVYGPTTWEMQNPAAPDFEDRFQRASVGTGYSNLNGGTWGIASNFLTQTAKGSTAFYIDYENSFTTASDYTAEYNVQETSRGTIVPKLGAVYGYVDANNYGVAIINGVTKQLETELLVGGVWSTQVLTSLPASFDSTKLHTIRVEKSGTTYKYFVDGMLKETKTGAGLGAGKVGYLTCDTAGKFGYIATSNKVNGSGIFDFYKPIPGTIQAVHYNSGGEGVGYHDTTSGNAGGKYIRNDNVDIRDNPEGGENIGWNATGEWYKYNVNVKANGTYNLGLRYATTNTGTQVRVWLDSTDVTGAVTLPSTGGWDNWQTYTIKGLNLPAGNHSLKVETVTGEYDFNTLQFVAADNASFTKTDNFTTSFSSDWNWSGGNWAIESGEASIDNMGKRTLGSTGWSDYTVETDIKGVSDLNSGIMVRVQNPAQGGAGDDPALGTDFYQGYFAFITTGGVGLGKQNYNWTALASTPEAHSLNTWYHMKVVVNGNNIKVYVGDMVNAKIDYTDNNLPFINGKVGYRAHNAHTHFDNFSVSSSCANESGPCSFSGQKSVRFGSGTTFVQGTFTDGVTCNAANFGDPTPGVAKTCAVTSDTVPTTGIWTYCAEENGTCTFTGTRTVAYGANGSYNYGTYTGSVACTNTTFTDPVAGVAKKCYTAYRLANGGFEAPSTANYTYGPMTNGWTFDSNAGVEKNGGGFGAANAPEGSQALFLQSTGSVQQSIALSAGTYSVNFRAAKRSTGGLQSFNVYNDSTLIGTFSPSSTAFSSYTTGTFTVTSGSHTIKFVGLNAGDNTDFIDAVNLLQN